jgi:hypothetical protein
VIRAYSVLIVVETSRKTDRAALDRAVANVVRYSTAKEAIETGLEVAIDTLEPFHKVRLTSVALGDPAPLVPA